jgi:phosphoribosyl 1,2-cyclic phosphodiesterase
VWTRDTFHVFAFEKEQAEETMRVTSLGSGSSGNAYLIEAGPQARTRLLVDAGFPARVLNERLRLANCAPQDLRGVLVTHEHSDHILGLPFLLKRYHVPVYADPRTLGALRTIFSAGELRSESGALVSLDAELSLTNQEGNGQLAAEVVLTDVVSIEEIAHAAVEPTLWRSLPAGTSCVIGDIEVRSFPVSHDAIAPCGYMLSAGGCRVCIITDSGEVTPVMLAAISQADLLILESNHDRARLLSGPYPYHLKQRILSSTGHLSNTQAAEAVLRTWRPDAVRWLWLAHLSRTNNTRKLALSSMQQSLRDAGANLAQLHISVLGRDVGSSWDSTRLWHDTHLWEMH